MKPFPKAIYVHPADFAKLQALATSAAPHRDAPPWATGFPPTPTAIAVHVTPHAMKGQPFFDPPESAPYPMQCTEHEDCLLSQELARACWWERFTTSPPNGTEPNGKATP